MDLKSDRSTKVRHMVRLSVQTFFQVILGLVLLGLIGWWGFAKWKERKADTQDYIIAQVQRGTIEDKVSSTGVLQPREYVDVGAQVSGQLGHLHVDIGNEVKVGDLLAEIDAEVSAAKVQASRAQLRAQRASLAEREINLVKAQRDLERQRNLMNDGATTQEALQNAETLERVARFQIEAVKAQIDQLQAGIRVDQTNLKYSKILSPMAGTVVSITARQGQTLNANQSAPNLLRVADLSVMTVQAQVSEADVGRLKSGMSVYFTTLGGKGKRWYGELRKIDPTPSVTNNVVLYNALFDVDNPNRQLMTQMTAQVMFVVSEVKDVLYVPFAALTFPSSASKSDRSQDSSDKSITAAVKVSQGELPAEERRSRNRVQSDAAGPKSAATVKVRKASGEIEVRDVVVGVTNRIQAEIVSGLVEGEKVIAGVRTPERPASGKSSQGEGGARNGGMQGGLGVGAGGRR